MVYTDSDKCNCCDISKTISIPNFVPPHGAAEIIVFNIFMRVCEN